ncbi:PQQ-dependent sugar dehydrogenase [Vibrio lentus]|nr:PQQ-dependent sugar dehydrogenase [Vibrio lentus]
MPGSILRLNADGSIPYDVFTDNDQVLNEIWSFLVIEIHKDCFYDFPSRKLWSIEHGPRGGDEIQPNKSGRYWLTRCITVKVLGAPALGDPDVMNYKDPVFNRSGQFDRLPR